MKDGLQVRVPGKGAIATLKMSASAAMRTEMPVGSSYLRAKSLHASRYINKQHL